VDDIIEEKKKELEEKEKEDMEKKKMVIVDQKKDSVDEEKSGEEKEKSVFASFKNYQNSNETNLRNRKHNQQNNSKNNKNSKNSKNNHKNTFVVERANRYSYKGGISEYQMLKKQLQNVGSMKKLDFSSFKKMMESKDNGAKKGTEKDDSATI